jgi:phosphatidylserine/phosphatidylglycerophosphate/cardiolipin synthase-like enzyme
MQVTATLPEPFWEHAIAETWFNAVRNAERFIYIEDQYFTAAPEFQERLVAKVADREIGALVIVLPAIGDQPFGEMVRSGFIADLKAADAGAGIVRIGYPRRHYTVPDNDSRASSGRLVLQTALPSSPGVNPTIVLGPKARVPGPPFWVAIEGELMYVVNESTAPNPNPQTTGIYDVVRGADTRLVKGGLTPVGARTREHPVGAAATVVDVAGIYVHAKSTIVDDVFLGIGSANINRRGHYHDGEITVYSVPQRLKASRSNPVAALRRRLWAEMLDLPPATAGPLLEDPVAAAKLFDRSPLEGNRFTDIEAYPIHLMQDVTGGDGLVLTLLTTALGFELAGNVQELYDGVIDPTSALELDP